MTECLASYRWGVAQGNKRIKLLSFFSVTLVYCLVLICGFLLSRRGPMHSAAHPTWRVWYRSTKTCEGKDSSSPPISWKVTHHPKPRKRWIQGWVTFVLLLTVGCCLSSSLVFFPVWSFLRLCLSDFAWQWACCYYSACCTPVFQTAHPTSDLWSKTGPWGKQCLDSQPGDGTGKGLTLIIIALCFCANWLFYVGYNRVTELLFVAVLLNSFSLPTLIKSIFALFFFSSSYRTCVYSVSAVDIPGEEAKGRARSGAQQPDYDVRFDESTRSSYGKTSRHGAAGGKHTHTHKRAHTNEVTFKNKLRVFYCMNV